MDKYTYIHSMSKYIHALNIFSISPQAEIMPDLFASEIVLPLTFHVDRNLSTQCAPIPSGSMKNDLRIMSHEGT